MKPRRMLLAALLALLPASPGTPEIIERVLVRVNDGIVTLSEFSALQLSAVQRAGLTSAAEIPAFLRENNARILQDAIDDLLLAQRAAELGLKIRPEYIDSVIEDIKKENNIASDGQLREQLAREGLSLRLLRQNIERSVVKRQLMSYDLDPKVKVEDAEVIAVYQAGKDTDYFRPATVKLQELVVGSRELAEQLVAQARSGEDFSALARAHSVSPTAEAGGDLGVFAKGELTARLEEVAFSLEPGGVSEPLPVESAYQVVRVAERTQASQIPFEEAKDGIRQRLTEERRGGEYAKYVEELRQKALIDVKVREVPLDVAGASEKVPPPGIDRGDEGRPSPRPGVALPDYSDEISVSPQDRPERVVPTALPGEQPSPRPTDPDASPPASPTPSPTPPPGQ